MEIKIRRLRADISQSDLAKQIGVSQSHLCNVENGRLSPSLRLLLSLRKLLGCTIDELLIGTDYVRKMIIEGKSAEEIKSRWKGDVEKFKEQRKPYLLYQE